jgi:two-component system sensor histidine kinase and response regulator WspE
MSNSNTDRSLLELFRSEVESHTAVLTQGLLAMENDASAVGTNIEAMMRAAHSVKGGARIVELDEAVRLAHGIEDCFVAVQKGSLVLQPAHIDVFLKAADMLGIIADNALSGRKEWSDEQIESLLAAIASISAGEFSPMPVKTLKAPEAVKPPESSGTFDKERMVRVAAGKIERLMGLAGEVVVSSRWLPSFFDGIMTLKKDQQRLMSLLEKLEKISISENPGGRSRKIAAQAREKTSEFNRRLMDRLSGLDMFTNTAVALSDRLYHEMVGVRMCPFSEGIRGFPRMVRDLARDLGKKVQFVMSGEATEVDRDILEKLDAPLNHLLRNALDHGIESPQERIAAEKPETGIVRLEAMHRAGMLMITVSDDGRGIDHIAIRKKIIEQGLINPDMADRLSENELTEFLFLPGFSTAEHLTEISGRGIGLDVAHNMVHEARGSIRAISSPGIGMTFQLELPLTLSVIRTFLVEIDKEIYAFPLARIDHCLRIDRTVIRTLEDRQYFKTDNVNVSLIDIRDLLDIASKSFAPSPELSVVIISDRLNTYGLIVDKFMGECDLVVRPLDARLGKVPNLSAAAVMMDGTPVVIFDVEDLVRSMDNLAGRKQAFSKISDPVREEEKKFKRILVADDSITVREKERSLLENKGYQTDTAVDGMDAWRLLNTNSYDMVLSDVDMPRMNGIELVRRIRQDIRFKALPVIIVSYKDSDEDRLRGLEAGANYYLRKRSFDDHSLIQAVVDLIGEA